MRRPLQGVWVGLCVLSLATLVASEPLAIPPRVTAIRNGDLVRMEFPATETGVQQGLDFVREHGGTVLLDSCEIAISKPLVVWDSTAFVGAGRNSILRLKDGPTSRVQAIRMGSYCRVSNLTLIGGGYLPHDRTPYNSKGIVAGTDGRGSIRGSTVAGCNLSDWNTTAIDLMGHSSGNVLRNNVITRSGWEGIYVAHYCDSNTVSGNLITDCRRNAIDVVGAFNQIEGNVVRGVGLDSLVFASDTYGILIYSRRPPCGTVIGNLVQKNIVENCYDGIVVVCGKDSDNVEDMIQSNDVFDNRRYGIWIGSTVGLTPLPRVRNHVAANNRVYRNGSNGIQIGWLATRTVLRGNEVFQNGGSAIYLYSLRGGTDSTLIADNVLHNNGAFGVEIDSLVLNTRLTGNTFRGNAAGDIRDLGAKTSHR